MVRNNNNEDIVSKVSRLEASQEYTKNDIGEIKVSLSKVSRLETNQEYTMSDVGEIKNSLKDLPKTLKEMEDRINKNIKFSFDTVTTEITKTQNDLKITSESVKILEDIHEQEALNKKRIQIVLSWVFGIISTVTAGLLLTLIIKK